MTVEIGSKFGKLTVQSIWESYGDILTLCRCECGLLVSATEKSLRNNNKNQCVECDEREYGETFAVGDVVFVHRSHYAAVCKQEAIVLDFKEIDKRFRIKVEFRGRAYFQKPTDLQNTGMKFL